MGTESAVAAAVGPEGKPVVVQELPPNAEGSLYYGNNGYPTHYFYDYHSGAYAESPGVPPETWEEYMRFMGMDSESSQQQAMYNAETGSMYVQTPQGYGYPSPGPYSAYGPGGPSMGVDGQLYGPQAPFPYPNPMFHQHQMSAGGQYIPGTANGTAANGTGNGSEGAHQGAGEQVAANGNGNGNISMSEQPPGTMNRRPGAAMPVRGLNSQGGGPRPLTPLQTFPQLAGVQTPGMAPLNGGRGFQSLPRNGQNGFGRGRGGAGGGYDNRIGGGRGGYNGAFDKGRGRGGRNGGVQTGNGTALYDVASEQNRGPRTIRMRGQRGPNAAPQGGSGVEGASEYNRADFRTKYEAAKFFVIKSYSEDDVHKSIKYGVWASTPTGNKRLEAAYQEAQGAGEKAKGGCPVFFFFSVNASGQFCGVAEMVGPVDHTKSVEYWQQDKWSGQFKVKWHIIKDVPNGQFRHIILANNENKPVTNSRDTQEVKFEQGLEILEIFKNYAAKTSILDDFTFYDDRQKAMQEKRARLQQQQRLRLRQQKQPGGQANPLPTPGAAESAPEESGAASRGEGSAQTSTSAGEAAQVSPVSNEAVTSSRPDGSPPLESLPVGEDSGQSLPTEANGIVGGDVASISQSLQSLKVSK